MFNIECSFHICLIFVSRVAHILGVVLNVSPSTYVEHPTFCISEWLAAFNL